MRRARKPNMALGRTCGWVCLCAALAVSAGAQQPPRLRLAAVVPMPGLRGRLDHMDADTAGHRLFLSALGNNTLEIFDTRTNRLIRTIRGLAAPQGVTFAPRSNRLLVASAADGFCRVFDGTTFRLLRTVRLGSDADDTRYDRRTGRVIVGYGEEGGAGLAILDGRSGGLLGRIKLPGHPESFQLAPSGPLIFVNIPTAGNVVDVVNRRQRRVVKTWNLDGARDNFPMALDAAGHRLFIICRRPAEMLVLDTETGRIFSRVPTVGDADDVWYDAARRLIFVSGGEGSIAVIAQADRDHYRPEARIQTRQGARTSLFVPPWGRLYLAVPQRGDHPAELRVYALRP